MLRRVVSVLRVWNVIKVDNLACYEGYYWVFDTVAIMMRRVLFVLHPEAYSRFNPGWFPIRKVSESIIGGER